MLTVGIPKEIMLGENRVAMTPDDCRTLVAAGGRLLIESSAGQASGYADADYQAAGGVILADADDLYQAADLVVKVKQPLPADLARLRPQQQLFCFLHLAADPALVKQLCEIGLTAIPFEAVSDASGYPLLAPMSAIAGRLAVLRGASLLFGESSARGVLLGGVRGADSGRVVVLGAGVAGSHAAAAAAALGAEVHVFDLNRERLAALTQRWPQMLTYEATPAAIAEHSEQADLVIGAVMLAGRRAPVVLQQSSLQRMPAGAVIVDIAIDQGGCVEGIRATTAAQPVYQQYEVLISAVPNMPGAVPRTASQALSSVITPYVLQFARGEQSPVLAKAVAIAAGEVIDPVLQEALA